MKKKTHGGKRKGSGRPKGEKTKVVRVAISKLKIMKQLISPDFKNCYIRTMIGCHCPDVCAYKKFVDGL